MGPLYLICTLTDAGKATMLDTSTESTSPTSRFFWITGKISNHMNMPEATIKHSKDFSNPPIQCVTSPKAPHMAANWGFKNTFCRFTLWIYSSVVKELQGHQKHTHKMQDHIMQGCINYRNRDPCKISWINKKWVMYDVPKK